MVNCVFKAYFSKIHKSLASRLVPKFRPHTGNDRERRQLFRNSVTAVILPDSEGWFPGTHRLLSYLEDLPGIRILWTALIHPAGLV